MSHGFPSFDESVSHTTLTPEYVPGTRRMDSSGNEYVYCYNAANASPVYPGQPVVVATTNTGYSFSITNAASQVGWVMAVCHHATVATNAYFWGMVRGLCRVVPDGSNSSFNAGKDLAIAVDGGFNSAPATLSTGLRWGFTIESIVTGHGSCASEATSGLACLGRAWIKTALG